MKRSSPLVFLVLALISPYLFFYSYHLQKKTQRETFVETLLYGISSSFATLSHQLFYSHLVSENDISFESSERPAESNHAGEVEIPQTAKEAEPKVPNLDAAIPEENLSKQEPPTKFSKAVVPCHGPECAPPDVASGPSSLGVKRVEVRHIVGNENHVIYSTNYTTFAALFGPDYTPGKFLPMLDLRAHRFDDTTYAANAGFVGRYIPQVPTTFCEILGFNLYYDYRQGSIGYYQEVGLGLEVLGSRWDFRGNAYVPFGAKKSVNVCVFDDYIGDYVITHSTKEAISYAFDAEIGYLSFLLIGDTKLLLYTAVGPYYIAGRCCHASTQGIRARIRPQYKDFIAFEMSVNYDSLFETIWQGQVIISLPLYQIGRSTNKGPCNLSNRQIYQPVNRFEVMPLGRSDCWDSNF